jgi:hypothetical protein
MEIEKLSYTTSIKHVDTIIADIEDHIKNKQDFVAFILIALGIEFLGAFFDDKDFDNFGQSEARFKNSVSNLFKDVWYKNNSNWLFEVFRGPLIHQYRAGDKILLTSVCKNNAPISDHLRIVNNKRVFVLEKLFEDFKLAASRLKNIAINVNQNKLKPDKIEEEYSSIYNVKQVTTNYEDNTDSISCNYLSSGTSEIVSILKITPEKLQIAQPKQRSNITPKKKKRTKK